MSQENKPITAGDVEELVKQVEDFLDQSSGKSQAAKRILLRNSTYIFTMMLGATEGGDDDTYELSVELASYYRDIKTCLEGE
ncbi:MAG: hypothetical protein HQ530_04315 [Parcubacteria group bacterium]|nr:hypothetical protein [Parcubacteria group bacterium]